MSEIYSLFCEWYLLCDFAQEIGKFCGLAAVQCSVDTSRKAATLFCTRFRSQLKQWLSVSNTQEVFRYFHLNYSDMTGMRVKYGVTSSIIQ